MIDKTVPDRVDVHVVRVDGIVLHVADAMFPKPPLPDAALAVPPPDRRTVGGGALANDVFSSRQWPGNGQSVSSRAPPEPVVARVAAWRFAYASYACCCL